MANYSPRLRFAGRPSLPLRGKEGERIDWFLTLFSAEGEERVAGEAWRGE